MLWRRQWEEMVNICLIETESTDKVKLLIESRLTKLKD
jgi:hypothetical protein